jgi:hypothetical protein
MVKSKSQVHSEWKIRQYAINRAKWLVEHGYIDPLREDEVCLKIFKIEMEKLNDATTQDSITNIQNETTGKQ